ncbi:MAG TPA: tetratricopeptide repeat protein [Alphaproteobacteria bacterium]
MSPNRLISLRFLRALLLASAALGVAACSSDLSLGSLQSSASGKDQKATADAMLRSAQGARDAGDLANAATLYKTAYDMAPGRTDILVELAQTLGALGAQNEAAAAYRSALEAAPKNADALRGLGNTLIALNQPRLALEQFQAALAIKPDPRLYNGMGVAHDMSGESATAQASYRSGLALAPNDPSLRNNLALSMALAGDYGQAIGLLAKLVDEPRAGTRPRQNLALVYGLAGRDQDAAKLIRVDFDERTVQNNLAYYETLRGMATNRRAAAIFGVATLPPMPPPRKPETSAAELPAIANDAQP